MQSKQFMSSLVGRSVACSLLAVALLVTAVEATAQAQESEPVLTEFAVRWVLNELDVEPGSHVVLDSTQMRAVSGELIDAAVVDRVAASVGVRVSSRSDATSCSPGARRCTISEEIDAVVSVDLVPDGSVPNVWHLRILVIEPAGEERWLGARVAHVPAIVKGGEVTQNGPVRWEWINVRPRLDGRGGV